MRATCLRCGEVGVGTAQELVPWDRRHDCPQRLDPELILADRELPARVWAMQAGVNPAQVSIITDERALRLHRGEGLVVVVNGSRLGQLAVQRGFQVAYVEA